MLPLIEFVGLLGGIPRLPNWDPTPFPMTSQVGSRGIPRYLMASHMGSRGMSHGSPRANYYYCYRIKILQSEPYFIPSILVVYFSCFCRVLNAAIDARLWYCCVLPWKVCDGSGTSNTGNNGVRLLGRRHVCRIGTIFQDGARTDSPLLTPSSQPE